MFRSLNVKLVLIFIIFIIAVMAVVGVFLLDRVSSFYADDFLQQMDGAFSAPMVNSLSDCLSEETPILLRMLKFSRMLRKTVSALMLLLMQEQCLIMK